MFIARIWKTAGYSSIIYLAVIAGIDSSIYEAAAIDGASRFQIIRRIMLPLLMPTVCILLLMDVGKMFYGDFGMVYALVKDSGQLLPKVDIIDTYVFRMLRVTGDPSLSMAVGMYQPWWDLYWFHYQLYCKKELSGRRAVLRARRRERNEKNKIVGNYHIYAGDSLFPVLHSADGACFHGIHHG